MHDTRTRHLPALLTLIGLGLGAGNAALAKDAAVSPLVSRGVDPLVVLNLTSLISSELDFMGAYEAVDQISTMPAGMNVACISSPTCLAGIAKANGAQAIVAGTVAIVGNKLDLTLVLEDSGRIVRKKQFTLPNIPSVIADAMSGHIKELVTGESATQAAAANSMGGLEELSMGDIMEDEEDVVIDATSLSSGSRGSSSYNDEEDLRGIDMAIEVEDAPAPRASEARRTSTPAPEPKRTPPPVEEVEPEEEIVFGRPAASEISVEEISFGSAASQIRIDSNDDGPAVASNDDNYNTRSSSSRYSEDERPSTSRSSSRYTDDDEDDRSSARSSSSRSSSSSSRSSSSSSRYNDLEERGSGSKSNKSSKGGNTRATVAARLGFSKFQSLNFLTYGGEAAFMATKNLAIVGGIEAYSSKRAVPKVLADGQEGVTQWNTILPFNLGFQYKLGANKVKPFLGADVVFIPGYVQEAGGLALGARARLGVDFQVASSVSLSLNGSTGYWSGQHFNAVAQGMKNSGIVPQISVGTLFAF